MNNNKKNEWLMKIKPINSNYQMTIYNNGLVYGPKYNEKLFMLKRSAVNEIKDIINEDLYMLKKERFIKHRNNGYIIKIKDTGRNHFNMKVVGWPHEKEIINILTNIDNVYKQYTTI